jgi:predicted DCC family thiol-disulfide oxidoreductase YuxK
MPLNNSRTIIFIDDECVFCNYWGKFILKHDKSKTLYISPSSSSIFNHVKEDCEKIPNPKETIILHHQNTVYERSNAVMKIALLMRSWHSIIVIGYIFPKFLRDFIYNLISRNRKKIMKDKCVIDELKNKERYLF